VRTETRAGGGGMSGTVSSIMCVPECVPAACGGRMVASAW
jgi:hypothetical protein